MQEYSSSPSIHPRAKFENRSIDYHDLNILPNAVKSHQFWSNSNKNNGHFTQDLHAFRTYFILIFFETKKSLEKNVGEI